MLRLNLSVVYKVVRDLIFQQVRRALAPLLPHESGEEPFLRSRVIPVTYLFVGINPSNPFSITRILSE